MTIVLVGKNSFLAQGFASSQSGQRLLTISHEEISDYRSELAAARCVINFSFHPALRESAYSEANDIDTYLAARIGPHAHYIMISSRMVYGAGNGMLPIFSENDPCTPVNNYGKNKLIIEDKLRKELGENRLTILRLSNIFGFEPGRTSFMGRILSTLKESGTINFDIAPDSRRDFLPVLHFQAAIEKILKAPLGGIFNIGCGIGLTVDEMSNWVLEGYGKGTTNYTGQSYIGQFILDMSKGQSAYAIPPIQKEELRTACIECGQRLRYV